MYFCVARGAPFRIFKRRVEELGTFEHLQLDRSNNFSLLCSTSHACVVSYSTRSLEENFSTQKKKKKKLGEDATRNQRRTSVFPSFFLSFLFSPPTGAERIGFRTPVAISIGRGRSTALDLETAPLPVALEGEEGQVKFNPLSLPHRQPPTPSFPPRTPPEI